jgi:hypothetical protein
MGVVTNPRQHNDEPAGSKIDQDAVARATFAKSVCSRSFRLFTPRFYGL